MDDRLMDEAISRMFSTDPKPTGLFVPNDTATAVAHRVLIRRGIRPGKDIDIISCNNDNSSLIGLDPRPASIDLRPDIIGERAVDQLMRAIHNPFGPVRANLLVEPRLVTPDDEPGYGGNGGALE
jgi:DNA-binding LacI/PurR family transcriptional regulator